MTSELRKTGISIIGDIPWGTHFCYFYETKQDLLDILVPYFKVGLENNDFCLWVISTPLTREEASNALRQAVPDLDRHLMERNIEILSHDEWYFKEGVFDLSRVITGWNEKLNEALARGYEGMRVSGNTGWIQKEGWRDFREYEKELAAQLEDKRMIVLCDYPLANHAAAEVLDVARNHQFAIARRNGSWDVLEAPELMQAKQEIKRLNEELEQRVIERTTELAAANEELRREIGERKRVEGQLKQSESQLAEAQRLANVGSWNWDLRSNTVTWSDQHYRIFGVDPRAFNPTYEDTIMKAIYAEDRALVIGTVQSSLKTHEPFSFYYRILRPDGEERVIHSQGNVVCDEHGEPIRMFGTAQDVTERKRAEAALRRSEDRIRLIIDTIPVMAWSLRADGVADFLNQRWMDYAGLSLEQFVEEPTRPVHPEDIPRVMEKWLADMAAGEPNEDEIRLRRADGEYRWFLVRNAPLGDEQGNVVKWYGVSIDIEERKRAEVLLHARGQEFRAFVENTPDQVIKYDREFHRVYVNPAVAKAYDLPTEALIGKPFGSVIRDVGLDVGADQLAQIRQQIAAVFDTGESSVYEITWPLPTGRRYYSIRYFPEFDLNAAVIYVWGISRDITELKETQHQILALTENSPDLIARFDHEGCYLYLNGALEKLIGIPAHELRSKRIGETLSDRIHPATSNDVLSLRGAIDQVFASGLAIETEIQVPLPGGERIFNVRLIPERDEAGQVSSVLHIGRDITERKRSGEMLQTFPRRLIEVQEAERRRVARELHDEIGQALTAIKLNLQAVEQSADSSPLAQLNESVSIVDRALQQVRDLSFNLRPSLLDDLGLIAALRWYVDREARRAGLIPEFVADLSEMRLPQELETACFRITQEALTNVVRHAQARRIRVELRRRGAELHLTVRDDGSGFDVDAVWRRRVSDGGLGLQGMQERALILNGKIEVKSAPAHGTEIHVWFSLTGIPSSAKKQGE